MGRLRWFPDNRYVGTREDMVVHDCDDEEQFAALSERVEAEELVRRTRLQAFGPDSLAEARNRGFRPVT